MIKHDDGWSEILPSMINLGEESFRLIFITFVQDETENRRRDNMERRLPRFIFQNLMLYVTEGTQRNKVV